jgi:hypothetical protein
LLGALSLLDHRLEEVFLGRDWHLAAQPDSLEVGGFPVGLEAKRAENSGCFAGEELRRDEVREREPHRLAALKWIEPNLQPGCRAIAGSEGEDVAHITRATIAEVGMDAMHYSANIGGLPVPVVQGAPVLSTVTELALEESEDPGFLILGGDLDGTVLTSVRREQRKLRAKLLGSAAAATCALCGCSVPIDCLRIAHIKRRSLCSEHERRDLANVMFACTLGCDHLFELGYIYVDSGGTIRPRGQASSTPKLAEAIARLDGRACAAYGPASATYFAAHQQLAGA